MGHGTIRDMIVVRLRGWMELHPGAGIWSGNLYFNLKPQAHVIAAHANADEPREWRPWEAVMPNHAATYSLPEKLLQQLSAEARKQGRPLSWIVRDALASYLTGTPPEQEEEREEVAT